MRITLGTPENLNTVLELIDEAAAWLRTMSTDQWATPWPDRETRDARVLRGLEGGKTLIVWDTGIAAATVTMAARPNPRVWSRPACECNLAERAVYAHRLIIARSYAGLGLGAQLVDWAGLAARRDYGAEWVRIDVWSANKALHDYYLGTGFTPCGYCADRAYPSGQLFQKPVAEIRAGDAPLFSQPPSLRAIAKEALAPA